MKAKIHTFERITDINAAISGNENFRAAIILHCDLILREFRQRKLFYKFIFSNNRFIVSTIIASVFYSRQDSFLSDITHECLKTGMVSPNTVSSLLAFFKVSGRISVTISCHDRRKKKYVINKKGCEDTLALLNTMVPSLRMLFPRSDSSTLLTTDDLPSFFKKYAKIHDSSIFLIRLIQDVEVFISKDSGHMILVCLYLVGINNNSNNETLSSIAKTCGVSRTHLRNIIVESERKQLLQYDIKNNRIKIFKSFLSMFESYMSYYFSFIQFGLEADSE